MKEVSLFDQKDNAETVAVPDVRRADRSPCTTQPAKEVKAYPKLNSKQPLYGSIVLNRRPRKAGPGNEVLLRARRIGHGGEARRKAGEEAEAEKPEEKPPKASYDRLYFDAQPRPGPDERRGGFADEGPAQERLALGRRSARARRLRHDHRAGWATIPRRRDRRSACCR